jgi:hypothetical protein
MKREVIQRLGYLWGGMAVNLLKLMKLGKTNIIFTLFYTVIYFMVFS